MNKKILITGAAGFIGFHLSKLLLEKKYEVFGIDNINDYYDVNLKKARLAILKKNAKFVFEKVDLIERKKLNEIFQKNQFEYVIHLAAQAGVRYSLENPHAYVDSNLVGFVNILESCRQHPVKHLIFASSSSVYGGNKKVPFSTTDNVDNPVSLYAATKKANELIAYSYSHLYNIPVTGLRFFTVYGPYGRPDMAYFSFTDNILKNRSIKVFNYGKMERDFTYIDDVIEGIYRLIKKPPTKEKSPVPYEIYNIGNNKPVPLLKFIETLEAKIGKEAIKEYVEMQPGDVLKTYADIAKLEKAIGFKPSTTIDEGLEQFVTWYKEYYL